MQLQGYDLSYWANVPRRAFTVQDLLRGAGRWVFSLSRKQSTSPLSHLPNTFAPQALEKKTKIIDEDGLFKLISASIPFMPKQDQQQQQQKSPAAAAAATQAAGRAGPSTMAPSSFFGGGSGAGASGSGAGAAAGGSARGGGGGAGPTHGSASGSSQLWVDKYKPRDSSELVGNTNLVKDLRTWLGSWEQVGAGEGLGGGGGRGRAESAC